MMAARTTHGRGTRGADPTAKRSYSASGPVRGICFRRNYGKSAALYCGFKAAQGDVVITMDADLQDSPDEIPELCRMIMEDGYDLVSGWKQKRYDNALTKNLPSKLFNATARRVTGIQLHDMNCGLKAYRREVVRTSRCSPRCIDTSRILPRMPALQR